MPKPKVTDLDIVRKEVFGDVGDEPNVYSDYDRCCELERIMLDASALAYCDNATLLSIQKLLNGTKWTPDTLESIATILDNNGYEIREPQDEDQLFACLRSEWFAYRLGHSWPKRVNVTEQNINNGIRRDSSACAGVLGEITVANLADAYLEVAKINHYMVGIVGDYTYDEYHDAREILISRQNDPKNSTQYNQFSLALNVLEMDCQRVHNTKP